MNKQTARTRNTPNAARQSTTSIDMPRPLPLSPTERGITRNASRSLVSVATSIKTAVQTITNREALAEFWRELSTYAGRNLHAVNGGETPQRAKTPRAKAATA